MESILNWKGDPIEVTRSRGGTLATANPSDNLVTASIVPWPPPEIVQKLCESRHGRDFDELEHRALARTLGFYCNLQSLHSEDALTWSVFGTLAYADQQAKCAFIGSLLSVLTIPVPPAERVNI